MKKEVHKLLALIMVIIMGTVSITTSAALGWEVLPIIGEDVGSCISFTYNQKSEGGALRSAFCRKKIIRVVEIVC